MIVEEEWGDLLLLIGVFKKWHRIVSLFVPAPTHVELAT